MQLCDKPLSADAAGSDASAAQALRAAAEGRSAMLIADDAWSLDAARALLDCLDPSTASWGVVTTRIQGLVPGAVEVPLELMAGDEAARLLLSVAGADAAPPYPDEVRAAVKACSGLPLLLSVAGGILADQA